MFNHAHMQLLVQVTVYGTEHSSFSIPPFCRLQSDNVSLQSLPLVFNLQLSVYQPFGGSGNEL